MPRKARIKNEGAIYHIMVRSISELLLFQDSNDKDRYLELIKKYQQIFLFKIYSYCIMDNHAHFIIDCCGSDVSKFMHNINQSYSQYYNYKYKRHGHVFQDRFKSIMVQDDRNLICLSAYIHNNPCDIPGFNSHVENYKYSSLGISLGLFDDTHKILDKHFILQYFGTNTIESRKRYISLVKRIKGTKNKDWENIEFEDEPSEYRSERTLLIRNFTADEIISFVAKYTNQNSEIVKLKYAHNITELRAVCVLIMRSLCNFKFKEICSVLGNITLSQISRLCNLGVNCINSSPIYKNIINDLITYKNTTTSSI